MTPYLGDGENWICVCPRKTDMNSARAPYSGLVGRAIVRCGESCGRESGDWGGRAKAFPESILMLES